MNKIKIFVLSIVVIGLFALPAVGFGQNYQFEVTAMEVEAYLEEDGSLSLWYYIAFQNRPGASAIDFVDIGMPSASYNMNNIDAEINGTAIQEIESSPYVPNGFALDLGNNAIQPGQSGVVTVWIPGIQNILFDFEEDLDYASFQFSPTWFDSQFEVSTGTEYRVTIILPPGVGNEEGIYYQPSNWPGSPDPDDIGRTEAEDRVYYSWFTNNANARTQYIFGAAFPRTYVPEDTIRAEPSETISAPSERSFFLSAISAISQNICCFGTGLFFIAIFGFTIYQGTVGANKRKMEYLPPKMKIEGNGIKRGLTAVEAAVLMEEPVDKVMGMVLFGVLKKEAATVLEQDPLKIEVSDPLPKGLHPYENDFLEASKLPGNKQRTRLQKMMVDLVKTVEEKMKGFSRKESIAYYQDIMRRAWKMVEEADTPEVKSQNYDQTLEWTMLDKDYEERTRRTFAGGPVFVPMWWPRYSPSYRQNTGTSIGKSAPSTGSITGGARTSLPNIPGSNFAANVINGTTGMAAGVVGNLTTFTSGITNRTNPIPQTSRSGSGGFRGGGGSSCACACACAGCACACAGGGR